MLCLPLAAATGQERGWLMRGVIFPMLISHWDCPQHAWSFPLMVPIETLLFQGSVPPASAWCFLSISDKSSHLLSELQEAKGQNVGPHSSIYDLRSLGNYLPLTWLLCSCLREYSRLSCSYGYGCGKLTVLNKWLWRYSGVWCPHSWSPNSTAYE